MRMVHRERRKFVTEHVFVPPDRLTEQHAAHARSARILLLDILDLLPLPIVFSLYQSSVRVVSTAIVQSRISVTHNWSQRLGASEHNTRSALRKSILQVHA